MKINQIQQISEIYGVTSTRKVAPKNSQESKKDQLEISEAARHFQTALKAAKDSPDVRADKVAEIKKQIDSGTYNVSAEQVAQKMMAGSFSHSI